MRKCNQDIWREHITQRIGVHDTLWQKVHTHITNASSVIIGTSDELLKLAASAHAKSLLSVNEVMYAAVDALAISRHTAEEVSQLRRNAIRVNLSDMLQRLATDMYQESNEIFWPQKSYKYQFTNTNSSSVEINSSKYQYDPKTQPKEK